MRKVYVCDPHCYHAHYQQKGGGFPIYVGAGVQRGHGLGGIFSGLAKMAIPMLKSAAKSAGKTLLQSGAQFAGDLLGGKNIKEAAKQRAIEAGKNIGQNVLSTVHNAVQPVANRNKKRKAKTSTRSLNKAKRRRGSQKSSTDIFN